MDSAALFPGQTPPDVPSTADRIRDAALKRFAAHGVAATSLRSVAEGAGVSVGLVQHHFGTKSGLVAAVDQHVLRIVADTIAATALPPPPADSLAELGHRVTSIVSAHPEVARYVVRALVDGGDIGATIFDGLVAISTAQWDQFGKDGLVRPDIDRTWAALHPLVLVLGTLILRDLIDSHLPEALTAPAQLLRWDSAVADLLRRGLFRDGPDTPPAA